MAARSRNRPRTWLAWLLVVVALTLITLAARALASPTAGGAAPNDPPCSVEESSACDAGHHSEPSDLEPFDGEPSDGIDVAGPDFTSSASARAVDQRSLGVDLDAGALIAPQPAVDGDALDGDALGALIDEPAGLTGAALRFTGAAGFADPDVELRHHRPSRWGRLDLSIAWRQAVTTHALAPATRDSELWLVAEWSR